MLWDLYIQTYEQVMANQPDIYLVVVDKQEEGSGERWNNHKWLWHQEGAQEAANMQRAERGNLWVIMVQVVPEVFGALDAVTPKLE